MNEIVKKPLLIRREMPIEQDTIKAQTEQDTTQDHMEHRTIDNTRK
jgi:hypothetical protein